MERFLSVVERYTEIPELTPCILHEFVEKIIVHTASDPKGKNRTQEIDIYYKESEPRKYPKSLHQGENETSQNVRGTFDCDDRSGTQTFEPFEPGRA